MAVISGSEVIPNLGQVYNLTCNVTGVNNLSNITIIYHWTKNNGTVIQVGTNSSTLHFYSVLQVSDAGQYTCYVTINSVSLVTSVNTTASFDVIIASKCIEMYVHS